MNARLLHGRATAAGNDPRFGACCAILRIGELEAENSEARQAIVALLAQVPLHQWIHFPAFARFVYRLTPLFLQRRQRLFSSPHWWIEQEGRLLHPLQWQDWLRAEFSYLTELLCGPLHWWGICDLALAPDGRLLMVKNQSDAQPALVVVMNWTQEIQRAIAASRWRSTGRRRRGALLRAVMRRPSRSRASACPAADCSRSRAPTTRRSS